MNELSKWIAPSGMTVRDEARMYEITSEIQMRLRKTAENVISIGGRLTEGKKILPHGQFEPWVSLCFGMSKFSAINYRKIAEIYGGKSGKFLLLPATVLLEMIASPVEIRASFEAMAEAGKSFQAKDVKAARASASESAKRFVKKSQEKEAAKRVMEREKIVEKVATVERELKKAAVVVAKSATVMPSIVVVRKTETVIVESVEDGSLERIKEFLKWLKGRKETGHRSMAITAALTVIKHLIRAYERKTVN